MKKTNKKGFTLVEIMIVVAIIGLLAAIGIPSFQKARSNSREKSCINNLRMTDAAKEQYAMDNNVSGTTAITLANLTDYIKGGTASLKCPEGNAAYTDATVGNLGSNPTCPNVATYAGHTLP